MAASKASEVRALAARRNSFTLLHIFSMWIEVGRVGRQIFHLGPGTGNRGGNGFAMVSSQIVHDHDVARPKRGHQHPFREGLKDVAVGRGVDGHTGRPAIPADRRDHGSHGPPAQRCRIIGPGTFRGAPPEARHMGLGPRFVKKHEPIEIPPFYLISPIRPRFLDVRAVLFTGPKRLLLYVMPICANTRWMATSEQSSPSNSRNSAKVVSGCRRIAASICSRCSGVNIVFRPARQCRGEMSPRCRRCWISFLTKPSETQNRLATDTRVSLPVS